jgi:ATPase subunit of ABC transporter with duplicated ATPase domains
VTVLIVSHDASFLDATVTDVLLLAHGAKQLEQYEGSYSSFKATKPEVRRNDTMVFLEFLQRCMPALPAERTRLLGIWFL